MIFYVDTWTAKFNLKWSENIPNKEEYIPIMMMMIIKNIDNIVLIVGVLSTISCVLWCMWEYSLDLDLSQVDHKNFGEEDNFIMPAFSLCFANPFLTDNLKDYGLNITIENYLDFLVGKYYDERMLKIDFEIGDNGSLYFLRKGLWGDVTSTENRVPPLCHLFGWRNLWMVPY